MNVAPKPISREKGVGEHHIRPVKRESVCVCPSTTIAEMLNLVLMPSLLLSSVLIELNVDVGLEVVNLSDGEIRNWRPNFEGIIDCPSDTFKFQVGCAIQNSEETNNSVEWEDTRYDRERVEEG